MHIGIVCYASVGGSGIVATELGKALASRGHQVHFISTETPFRLGEFQAGLSFHQVLTPTYPLFREPQYLLSLANKIVQVSREFELDVVHAHYAVPHATAAFLAQQVLARTAGPDPAGDHHAARHRHHAGRQRSVVLGDRRVFDPALEPRDGGVREPARLDLRSARRRARDPRHPELSRLRDSPSEPAAGTPQAVHPRRRSNEDRRAHLEFPAGEASRRRRADLRSIRKRVPARLLLVGDGPDLRAANRLARELGIWNLVDAVGAQEEVLPLLSISDLFLLPSAQESFGLAALEAMACEVPVIASRVGGLPEVIEDGVTGFLHPPDALDEMAESGVNLLTDPDLHAGSPPPPAAASAITSASSASSRCTSAATRTPSIRNRERLERLERLARSLRTAPAS